MGKPHGQRLVDGLAIDGETGREPHPLIVPGRFRVPLIREIHGERALDDHRLEAEARRALQFFGELAADRIGNVDLAPLERRQTRGLVRDHFQNQTLYAWRVAPVRLEGLQHQLDAGRERNEPVRAGADGGLPESIVSDLRHVFAWHDPGSAGRARIEGEEVRPRLLQLDAHVIRCRCVDRIHALLQ
jgi:hypothetical protein